MCIFCFQDVSLLSVYFLFLRLMFFVGSRQNYLTVQVN